MMAQFQKAEETEIASRAQFYNSRCRKDSDRVQLIREPSQPLTCRGPLRLHWDVRVQMNLLESDGSKPLNRHYYSSQVTGELQQVQLTNDQTDESVEVFDGVRLRRRPTKHRQVIPVDWRRSVNGHAFTGPSCVQPESGHSVTVLADIQDRTHQVISRLFTKYLIRDPPDGFCIVVLAPDGWELTLSQLDCPLWVRLSLGPDETRSGKLMIRELGRPSPRASILELAGLPTPLLNQLLVSIDAEEAADVALTQRRYAIARSAMEAAVRRLGNPQGGSLSGRQFAENADEVSDSDDTDSGKYTPRGEHMSHL